MSDVTLTASIRSNLLSLQNTTRLLDTTSERLSTGKRVNSALDNPNSFFTARGLSNRAGDLTARKDSIGQSISLLQATDKSINSITALVEQAKAVAQQAEEAATGAVASTTGVATVSSQAAALSGVTTISTEAAAAATGAVTTISTAARAAATGSVTTISSQALAAAAGTVTSVHTAQGDANITDSSANTLATIFTDLTATDQFTITVAGTGKTVKISSTDILDDIKTNVEAALDNVTVTIDTAQDELNFAVAGGGVLTFTDTIAGAVADLGLQDSDATAIASGGSSGAFATTQSDSDLIIGAFASSVGDVLLIDVNGDGGASQAAFTVGSKTVAELVTFINDLDSDVTAVYNATSKKIDITSTNGGDTIEFTDSAGTPVVDLLFNDGTAVVTTGAVATFATTGAATDTLVAAYSATATDVLTIDYNGSTVDFTVGSSSIADLVTAITNIDSDITATYNTTTSKIDITSGVGGAQLTFNETNGDPLTELGFITNDSTTIVSGTATSFLTTATGSDLASVAFGLDASDTFTVALTNGGSTSVVIGSQTIDQLVATIAAVDSALTASFNTTTSKIDVSAATGAEITFTDASAVAQVDTVTLAGDVEAGDVHTITVNGNDVSYTVIGADLTDNSATTNAEALANVATKLAAAVTADAAGAGALVTATTSGADVILTAATAGTKLDVSAETTNDVADVATLVLAETVAPAAAAKQTETLTIAGTLDAGQVLSYTLNSTTYSHTVTSTDTVTTAATALAALISANSLAAAVGAAGVITITGATNGIGWNSSESVALNDTATSATVANTTAAVGGDSVSGLTLDGVFSSVTSGVGTTYTDTTAAVTSGDLLASVFSDVSTADAFTITTANGGTTTFTVGAATTVADLVTAISSADSALTASYNTTSQKIDITASDDTAVTFTNSVGTLVTDLGLSDGTASVTSGSAVTYGLTVTTASTEITALNSDYQSILEQIDTLLNDASYKGTNLLKGGNDFTVKFNADGTSSLTLTGLDLGVTGNTNLKFTLSASGYDFNGTGITTALADTQNAIDHLRSVASTFGTGLGIIQTREAFTSELVSVLQSGADKLVNANLEEESANLLALQTRQALGIQSLSIANQSQQSVLSLFR